MRWLRVVSLLEVLIRRAVELSKLGFSRISNKDRVLAFRVRSICLVSRHASSLFGASINNDRTDAREASGKLQVSVSSSLRELGAARLVCCAHYYVGNIAKWRHLHSIMDRIHSILATSFPRPQINCNRHTKDPLTT